MLNNTKSKSKLDQWRNFRKKDYTNIYEFVEKFPFQNFESRYLDYYTPKSWPNPFEIVSDGYLCQSGITLVLTASLLHKNYINPDELCLPVISNNITGSTGLALVYEDSVFNFTPGKIETLDFVKEHSTVFQTHRIPTKELFLDI